MRGGVYLTCVLLKVDFPHNWAVSENTYLARGDYDGFTLIRQLPEGISPVAAQTSAVCSHMAMLLPLPSYTMLWA